MAPTSTPKRGPKSSGIAKSAKKSPKLTKVERLERTPFEGPTPALDKLVFTLIIETTNTSPRMGFLLNRFEEPDSEIVALKAGCLNRFDRNANRLMELTRFEKATPAYVGKTLTLESLWKTRDGRIVDSTRRTYKNEFGFFTVAEMVAHVEDFERIDRPKSKWFGGVDCHHIFFEGLRPNGAGDAFRILWGS